MDQQITASPEVREILGADHLRMLAGQVATGYRCVVCGQWGDQGDEPLTVVVLIKDAAGLPRGAGGVADTRVAHQRCSPSVVIADAGTWAPKRWAGMTATAAVLPGDTGPRALLVTEAHGQLISTGAAEATELGVSGLLHDGLHLMPGIWQAAPAAPGWSARIGPGNRVTVAYPDRSTYFTGRLDLPREWRAVAARLGEIELISGVTGFSGDPARPQEALSALAGTARQGRLVGGTIQAAGGRGRRRWPLARGTRSS